jgi:hypothetical protein
MFDISCLYGQNEFQSIEQDAYNFWNASSKSNPLDSSLAQQVNQKWNIPVIGQLYFVNQGPGPFTHVFDFSSTGKNKGNPNATFFGSTNDDVVSPDGVKNVNWLQIDQVPPNGLTRTVYRVNTVLGQQPVSDKERVVSSSRTLDSSSYSIDEKKNL